THRNSFIRAKPIFAVWVGSSAATTPIFEAAGIPSYATESDAVRGFMHLVRYREALEALMATPPSVAQDFKPDVAVARGVVAHAADSRARCAVATLGLIRSRARACLPPTPFRSHPRCLPAMATKPPPRRGRFWRRGRAW